MLTEQEQKELQSLYLLIVKHGPNAPGRAATKFAAAFRRVGDRLLSAIPLEYQQMYATTLRQRGSIALPYITRQIQQQVQGLPLIKALKDMRIPEGENADLESVEMEISR